MGNYSSNFSAYKGIGWRSLFGSAIALYALSGVSYIFGCRLAQSILSLIAAMIILIINIVASLPEKVIVIPDWNVLDAAYRPCRLVINMRLTWSV